MWDVIKFVGDKEVKDRVLNELCDKALLTKNLMESFGGDCRTLIMGVCVNEESEKDNTLTLLRVFGESNGYL